MGGDSLKMIEADIIKVLEELKKNTTGEALELFDRHMWENLKCVPWNAEIADPKDVMPEDPIKIAMWLIEMVRKSTLNRAARKDKATGSHDAIRDKLINMRSKEKLRQIAEHLLIYCNSNEGVSK